MAKGAVVKEPRKDESKSRPDLFTYQDYRAFLRDWIDYLKTEKKKFSLRQLALQAGLGSGYLSTVLAGKQPLSSKGLTKIIPHLELEDSEKTFLELLRTVAESDDHSVRMEALNRIQRFRAFGQNNPQEVETFQYLSRWYHVAIREMAGLKGFNLEPAAIQRRLKSRVPLKDIEEALRFLIDHRYIELDGDGKVKLPEKQVQCFGKIYQIALRQFHREMFRVAGETLDNTSIEHRHVLGHTVAVSKEGYTKIRDLMETMIRSIADITKSETDAESVYHVMLGAFPLTEPAEGKS